MIERYWKSSIVNKIIILNIVAFILTIIFGGLGSCGSGGCAPGLMPYIALPMNFPELFTHPWTLVTHMFTHSGFMHLLFNMITLYFAGGMFLSYFSQKKFLQLYFGGGILAALLTIAINYYLQLGAPYAVGASAAVVAILIAVATYAPNQEVSIYFLFKMKLKWFALLFVLIEFISIPDSNAGGHIAHLCGALFGYLFVVAHKKRLFSNGIFSNVSEYFKSKPKVKEVKKTKMSVNQNIIDKNKTIDRILDKISKSGMNSLTTQERETLINFYQK